MPITIHFSLTIAPLGAIHYELSTGSLHKQCINDQAHTDYKYNHKQLVILHHKKRIKLGLVKAYYVLMKHSEFVSLLVTFPSHSAFNGLLSGPCYSNLCDFPVLPGECLRFSMVHLPLVSLPTHHVWLFYHLIWRCVKLHGKIIRMTIKDLSVFTY
jgi:hypothetical protein